MGTASVTRDYANANALTLKKWRETFGDSLGIALTDTFGTETFLHNFRGDLARQYAGVRQDSGDPKEFVDRIVGFYKEESIDPSTKTIVFSDGLDVDRCIELRSYAVAKGIKPMFGVGTFLTSIEPFLLS